MSFQDHDIRVKGIVDEDFSNYKKCSIFIIFPTCSLKCDKENGTSICQNSSLLKEPDIKISVYQLCRRYISNPLTSAVVIGGLEPFDTFEDLRFLISTLRNEFHCDDDIVVYTGYREDEIKDKIDCLSNLHCMPLIIKFGRFKPNQESHLDEILGVNLANEEQYAKIIN